MLRIPTRTLLTSITMLTQTGQTQMVHAMPVSTISGHCFSKLTVKLSNHHLRVRKQPRCLEKRQIANRNALISYLPALVVSLLGVILFAISFLIHTYQLHRYRTWYFIPVLIGTLMEVVGYIFRTLSGSTLPSRTSKFSLLISHYQQRWTLTASSSSSCNTSSSLSHPSYLAQASTPSSPS